MSNEAFDKNIKAKLEQINPAYEEKAWEKFAPLLPAPSGGLLPLWGQILTMVGAIATIVYLGYNNFQKEATNKQLMNEIKTLKTNSPTLSEKTIFQKDTIYITKYIDRIIEKSDSEAIVTLKEKNANFQKTEEIYKQIINQKNVELSDNKAVIEKNKEIVKNKLVLENTKENYTPMTAATEIEGVQTGIGKTDKSSIEEKAVQPEAEFSKVKVEEEKEKLPEIAKNRPEKEDSKKKIVRGTIGLSGINFDDMAGVGIITNFKIWNNWGLNIGIDGLLSRPDFFEDEKAYKIKKNRPFEDNLGALGPKNGGLYRNIRGIRQLIALPINIQYTYDLPRNYSIFANAGTALQLYSKDRFRFDLSQQLGQFAPVDFNTKLEPRLFGNLTTALGLQKEWNRFVLQASPSYVFNLQKERLLEPSMFGLRINAMYRLYK